MTWPDDPYDLEKSDPSDLDTQIRPDPFSLLLYINYYIIANNNFWELHHLHLTVDIP